MITNGAYTHSPAIGVRTQFLVRSKWFFGLLTAALLSVASTNAPPPLPQGTVDEQYIQIMAVLDQADKLKATGQADASKKKYRQVEQWLVIFKRANPLYFPKTVAYRLNQVSEEVESRPPTESAVAKPKPKPQAKLEAEKGAEGLTSKSAVKLLDAGAEPRKQLRFHAKAGDKQLMLATFKMNIEMPGLPPKQAAAMPRPNISVPVDVSVEKVAPDGEITFDAVLGEPGLGSDSGLKPQDLEKANKQMATVKGLALTLAMTSTGSIRLLDIKAPTNAPPDMEKGFENAKQAIQTWHTASPLMPLPEEAVGSGAKWEVTTVTNANGMDVNQTSTFTLQSVEGDHVNLNKAVDFTISGVPTAPPGATVTPPPMASIDITGKSTGTSALDLSKVVPLKVDSVIQAAVKVGMKMGTNTMPMSVKADVKYTIEAH